MECQARLMSHRLDHRTYHLELAIVKFALYICILASLILRIYIDCSDEYAGKPQVQPKTRPGTTRLRHTTPRHAQQLMGQKRKVQIATWTWDFFFGLVQIGQQLRGATHPRSGGSFESLLSLSFFPFPHACAGVACPPDPSFGYCYYFPISSFFPPSGHSLIIWPG